MRQPLPFRFLLAFVAVLAGVLDSRQSFAQDGSGRFELGEIVVVGRQPELLSSVGGTVVTQEQIWTFSRLTLEQAANLAPGVVSTLDSNGRRNESDIFVRGFGRTQVPLMVDGVRVYLPADNRLDFARFLTADIVAIQVQKGYASVIDGPGAMGGAINLVTRKPTRPFELDSGIAAGGRDGVESWNAFVIAGTRQERYYLQGSFNYADRDSWSLSSDYEPTPNSLEDGGERDGSNTDDWRANLKFGFTPNETDEYTLNFIQQEGEKGAPLNVYNNPPVPGNSFWLWPYWDIRNLALLTKTEFESVYLKTKTYYNTFENGLNAYDDITYTTQNLGRSFFSPYDDHAYGTAIEVGTTQVESNTLKAAFHWRTDVHTEQQTSQPTDPLLRFTEPEQEQSQDTWSIALENTYHARPELDLIVGLSYDEYVVTRAEEFDTDVSPDVFEYPRGGSDAFNGQAALVYRYSERSQLHASVSDRSRFPTFFELYSTRFGTATPNPDLGPERATNVELGWERTTAGGARLGAAVFYNDVRDLIQTVVLPDTTTQSQNVGDGRFYGLELFFDARLSESLSIGGNYSYIDREIEDALQPDLRPEGVPESKGFLYATWEPTEWLSLTPNIEIADDRWSAVNPVVTEPYVKTGSYTLVNLNAQFAVRQDIELSVGFQNILDDNYALAWGFPQPGRTVFAKMRVTF
jgi:iron complex outermembrane receptor protein